MGIVTRFLAIWISLGRIHHNQGKMEIDRTCQICSTATLKKHFSCNIYFLFFVSISGLTVFQDISGLAISGLESFEN
jgi:hypothetical protein